MKYLVGVHLCVFSISSPMAGCGEDGREEFEEPPNIPHFISKAAMCGTASFLVSVSSPGRNHFQQWEDMERDLAFLPPDPVEFGDGEEESWGYSSRGSWLLCGGVEKNQWWVMLYSNSDFNRLLTSPVMPLET